MDPSSDKKILHLSSSLLWIEVRERAQRIPTLLWWNPTTPHQLHIDHPPRRYPFGSSGVRIGLEAPNPEGRPLHFKSRDLTSHEP